MIRNIVFDLGGVLVDFHPAEGMRKLGFSKEAASAFQKNIFSRLWELCDRNPLGSDEIRNLFKSRVKGFEREVDLLWDNITAVTGVYDYSCDWIKSLKKRGFRLYVLSNFGQQAFETNSKLYTFLNDMDGKVVSYEIGYIKPEPEIYRHLFEKYGLNPSESVFIDDRMINVDGAEQCGMKGICFKNYEQAAGELERMISEA